MEQHPGEFHYSNLCRRHPISFNEQLPFASGYSLKMDFREKGNKFLLPGRFP
jgi:hypothetical protein